MQLACCRCCLHVPQGDFRAKTFDIVHVVRSGSGKGQRVVASVKKESKFSSGTAFLK